MKEIEARYEDRFDVHGFSLGGLRGEAMDLSREAEIRRGPPRAFCELLEWNLPGNPRIET